MSSLRPAPMIRLPKLHRLLPDLAQKDLSPRGDRSPLNRTDAHCRPSLRKAQPSNSPSRTPVPTRRQLNDGGDPGAGSEEQYDGSSSAPSRYRQTYPSAGIFLSLERHTGGLQNGPTTFTVTHSDADIAQTTKTSTISEQAVSTLSGESTEAATTSSPNRTSVPCVLH